MPIENLQRTKLSLCAMKDALPFEDGCIVRRPKGRYQLNTCVWEDPESGEKGLRYYDTDIIVVNKTGVITLNTDGYTTATTKNRINYHGSEVGAGGVHVYQKKHIWYVVWQGNTYLYHDNMQLLPDGSAWLGVTQLEAIESGRL